jgi:hypothetical protein
MDFFDKGDSANIYTSISGQELADIVHEMGFVPHLSTDKSGDPVIRFNIEGLTCTIWFYGVKDERANSLQFSTGFADKISPSKVSEWNANKRYLKAYLDTEGDVIGNMDVDLDGGVTQAFLVETLRRWRGVFLNFVDFMSN